MERVDLIRPGKFGRAVFADNWRDEFDVSNETIIYHNIPVDFVFIGDSITNGWDTNAYFGRGKNFIVNRGIPGDTTTYVLKRFDADVIQLKPSYVIIKIGINNMAALDAWIQSDYREPDEILSEIVSDLNEMVKKALKHDIAPILCTIIPTCIKQVTSDLVRRQLVVRVNSEIKAICSNTGAIFVDYHSHMTCPDGMTLRRELTDDGLHPHVLGYDIMAEVLRCELKENGINI